MSENEISVSDALDKLRRLHQLAAGGGAVKPELLSEAISVVQRIRPASQEKAFDAPEIKGNPVAFIYDMVRAGGDVSSPEGRAKIRMKIAAITEGRDGAALRRLLLERLFLESRSIPHLDCLIAWDPDTKRVAVGRHPDLTGWSNDYACTAGACYASLADMTPDQRLAQLFIDFHTLVVGDGIPAQQAHEAFLSIKEYRAAISPDIPGAGKF